MTFEFVPLLQVQRDLYDLPRGEVVSPFLDAVDQPTLMACVFGDEAARMLGYRPQGPSERAGLALALYDARLAMANAI